MPPRQLAAIPTKADTPDRLATALQGVDDLAVGGVPELDGLVITHRIEGFIIGAEHCIVNLCLVATAVDH